MLIRFIAVFLISIVLFALIATFLPNILNFVWLAIGILFILCLGYLAAVYIQKIRRLIKQK
ncbi:hypothetical protein AAV35_008055 [Salimicrobium jeotgali]|uniref:Uncharacterized protein n=2 Tax=Salimicrobium TaxID=351195 RepID=K2H7U5_9BACI|nr:MULTISPECIES: hypothetical protein [Salimicrobium]AKG04760.1 hypothetical protein AAV35_008055 [Salimicrobium jeotgali]EKE31735.1 hypothetical protein MJ3_06338 [Salimicrobium jeotgali]MBM7696305.1 putative membrane protein [Salimicrobium jeotgali]PBB06651.1 hypothetical protein CKW00_03095 [Salimicrobium humidisoli]